MFFNQTGQVVPGALLSISLASGLGVTASPAITEFITKAELASITYAKSALTSSLQINHLLAKHSSTDKLIIEGQEVTLKYGYPVAQKVELEKVASFGTQILIDNDANIVTVWSLYSSWCFIYEAAEQNGNAIKPANVSEILSGTNELCKS